ncbi:MAG: putative glycoside hydrolase [Oscillospiraceae bacterium]
MAKRIKHYRSKSIYGRSNRRKRRFKKIAIWVVSLIVLFYAGYYLIGAPLVNKNKNEGTSNPTEIVSTPNNNEIISENNSIPPENTNTNFKSGYADFNIISSKEKLSSHLKTLKENGYNSCAFELKDQTGTIFYNTSLEQAEKAKAKSETPVDLDMILQVFNENAIIPLPIISAFKDQKAATKLAGAAIWYQNTEGYLWLDNYADKGGKPWLNPFSSVAKKYICDIQNEILSKGFKNIIIDNVKFGAKINNNLAGFGSEATGKRIDAITSFTKQCEEVAKNNQATVFFAFDIEEIVFDSTNYIDGNVLQTGVLNIAPVYGIASLKNNITIGTTLIENPKDMAKDTTIAINNLIKSKLPQTRIVSILTDYDSIKSTQKTADTDMEYIEK